MTENKQKSQPPKAPSTSEQSRSPIDNNQAGETTEQQSKNQQTTSQSAGNISQAAQHKPHVSGGSKLASIAIVLTIVCTGALTLHMQQQRTDQQAQLGALRLELSQARSAINTQLDEAKQQAVTATQAIATQAEQLLNQQKQSVDSLHLALAEVQGRRPNDWLLAEADYLIKLAGRKLYLERDVDTATLLVQEADLRIAELNDPSLMPLRRALSHDITQLQGTANIDRDGLVLRLMTLQQQVDQLPLAHAILPAEAVTESSDLSQDLSDWKTNLRTSLKAFADNFITFRVRDGQAIPLLSPQQEFYLRENVKAKLDTAIKAVYHEQPAIYQLSLDMALQWSNDYFQQENQQVKAFNHSLAQLVTQEVKTTAPRLSAQQPLEDVIRERLRRSVTPIMMEEHQ